MVCHPWIIVCSHHVYHLSTVFTPCQVRSEMQKKELWQNLFIDLFSKWPSLQRLLIWHNWSLSPSLYCWFDDWYELHFDERFALCERILYQKSRFHLLVRHSPRLLTYQDNPLSARSRSQVPSQHYINDRYNKFFCTTSSGT